MNDKPRAPSKFHPASDPNQRVAAGLISVAEPVGKVARAQFSKRGFASAQIITEWHLIVGSAIATTTLPLRVMFPRGRRDGGSLYVKVTSGAMATQFQHLIPQMLERINGYFGYKAVERISMSQGPLPRHLRRKPQRPTNPVLSPDAEQSLQDKLAVVDDPDLRALLAKLGRHLASKA